jgi:hypothetical protein
MAKASIARPVGVTRNRPGSSAPRRRSKLVAGVLDPGRHQLQQRTGEIET